MSRTRSLLLSLIAGAALVAADDAQPLVPAADAPAVAKPAADKPATSTFSGIIQTKKGMVLRVVMDEKDRKEPKDKEPRAFELTDKTKITVDGKESTLKKLQPEQEVTITYDDKGVISVDEVAAKKKKKK